MDTQTVAQSTTDKIMGMLEALAKKLGTTGEYLWGVLVKQGYLELYTDIAYIVASFIVAMICTTTVIKEVTNDKRIDKFGDWQESKVARIVVCGTIGIISLLTCLLTFNGLMMPEAYALNKIIEVLK